MNPVIELHVPCPTSLPRTMYCKQQEAWQESGNKASYNTVIATDHTYEQVCVVIHCCNNPNDLYSAVIM